MKKIDQFTGKYAIQKTLRFSLIPVGKTEDNFRAKALLEEDEQRKADYEFVKGYIDAYHRAFINRVLGTAKLSGLEEYADLFKKTGKSETDAERMDTLEDRFREQIADTLKQDPEFKKLLTKEMIRDLLPKFLKSDEEKAIVARFDKFTTYFTGFFKNRENIYSDEKKATAIGFRCIHDNLPRYLGNLSVLSKILANLSEDNVRQIKALSEALRGCSPEEAFSVASFHAVLTQLGIETYNKIIGGYVTSDGNHEQGINQFVNLYNQNKSRSERLPLLKPLYKQILSDRVSLSYIPEAFSTDEETLQAIRLSYTDGLINAMKRLETLFSALDQYDASGIYVSAGSGVTTYAQKALGGWHAISDVWEREYDERHPKRGGNYEETREKAYKAIKSFSLAQLTHYAKASLNAEKAQQTELPVPYFSRLICSNIQTIRGNYAKAERLLTEAYTEKVRLAKNDAAIELLKELLDSTKELAFSLKSLRGSEKEEQRDELFYGEFFDTYDALSAFDRLYDKVRNYITKKPYSTDKIKLNFGNYQLLNGWDKNKEKDYCSILLRKDGMYYLGVMDRSYSRLFENYEIAVEGVPAYEKVNYKLLPGPNKMLPKVFFSKSGVETFAPSSEILRIYHSGSFKKGVGFSIRDCYAIIDFYKAAISRHPDWSQFGFNFRPTKDYLDIGEFYNEVKNQGYRLTFDRIPAKWIEEKVETGELYLFQIYNKDFSPNSHGTPNMHTLFFKMLFDERNLENVVYKLNGEAELFYRKASINPEEATIHPANIPLKNKNEKNKKKTSLFPYELVKDRRYTKRQFSFHVPISLNFQAGSFSQIGLQTRMALRRSADNYVIGIDRGERNLLYICVVNSKGEIVEQYSLNEIVNAYGSIDYHTLLEKKEKERDEARKSWKTIENIKELKAGYLSQVIHKICELVVRYDAVIAMEDLNSGFKNTRKKVEKQVYQNFEKALIDKLNYLVDKAKDPEANGGLLHAYQLTEKFESFSRMGLQNGFIFYIPAWLTSKIDPVTGFVDLLRPVYSSVEESRSYLAKIDAIRYSPKADLFEFDVDYANYPKTTADYRKKWTICTNGTRIHVFRSEEQNGNWTTETVVLTEAFRDLFETYGIDYRAADLKEKILGRTEKPFYEKFMRLFKLTLQMRNSIPNSDVDYLISPVRGSDGTFFDSREASADLPQDADANGAYNIARKALWAIRQIQAAPEEEVKKVRTSISNAAWLEFAQNG